MVRSYETTPEFQQDVSLGLHLEIAQFSATPSHDFTAELFPPLPSAVRGRATDASINRVHATHSRAFTHSPQPSYSGQLDSNLIRNQTPLDGFFGSSPRATDPPMDQYFPPSTSSAVEDYLDASIMAAQYLDLAHHCSSGHLDPFTHSYPPSETSASSPEATDTASSSSPQAKILSVNSSPGYRQHDLPEPTDTARPHAGFGRHPSSPNYLDPYTQHVADRYPDSLLLPRPSSFHETPMQQRPAASWNQYPMPSLPFISQTSRVALSHPPSPTTSHMLNAFEHYPVSDDLRRWPQMFKITQVKKIGAKKQTMACLFCRERKIGCTRPAEDNLDQTCNQCARRKRRCEYPTESRRGQHTRNRLNSKKFLGLDDTLTLAPPTLPTSI